MMRKVAIIGMVLVPSMGFAGVLSTAAPNNGSGGIFMNLTSAGQALSVTSFDTYFSGSVGLGVSVQVWTRAGTYVGFDASNAGWTLSQTASATAAGTTTLAPLALSSAISIGAGQTVAVYLHSITTGGGIRYTGTSSAPPQTTWSNADLTLFSDVSRTGTVPFGGSRFSPRTFAGNVNYSVVPEPASMAALALGAGALLRRRRRA